LTGATAPPSTPLARACRLFGATQCRGYSPLYEALSDVLAGDDDLLGLLSAAPAGQARPTLLLAAVHYLLLGGIDHPLAQFYPSVATGAGDGGSGASLADAFRSFCRERRAGLMALIESGRTQTNDVRRTAALVLALQEIERRSDRPLALVEVGASAGLNLLYRRYRYRFGETAVGVGRSGVEVRVSVDEAIGSRIDPVVPAVASAIGIDVAPIDLSDPDQVRWLRSFVWPELSDDADRLMAAIEIAGTAPPTVVRGDGIDMLPGLVGRVPQDVLPVVFHSTLLTYLNAPRRVELFETLATIGRTRPVAWIALESPGLLATAGGIDLGLSASANTTYVLTTVLWRDSTRIDTPLARVDPYGRWIRSLDPAG
jgi:hypothetical protein